MTSPVQAVYVASFNTTSDLKQRAQVTWSAIQSDADVVKYANVIVDVMTQRVTSAVTSLATSQRLRAAVNTTLNDFVPTDISAELKITGGSDKMC